MYFVTIQHAHIKRHIESVHKSIKAHQCNICQKTYGQKSTLKRHMELVQEKKKPLKCDKYEYMVFKHSHLRKHQSVFMKISTNTNVIFAKRTLVRKMPHNTY